jgi:alkylation response protein AidB-like acyl-CoA dehydrogenase
LAKGEVIGAFCLSEPEAGSDATSQKTTAIDKGDYYLLNGTKNWITNGSTASTYLVIAQTDVEKGHKGINAFIVEKGWEGFDIGPKEKKMGIRGSDTHSLLFNDVKVPKENRIGADGFGFAFAMNVLNGGRIGIASQALGIATGAYEIALKYSKERKAFGKEIFNHQAIAFKLADMYVKVTAAKLLVMKAACEKDEGKDIAHSGAMAKLYASEIALEVANEAVQIHGGNGYVAEYHVERMMRDSKITQIYEGTSEIQRIVISRRGLVSERVFFIILSKGALITLSELLAEEYKEQGIAFNVLALGAVNTEMLQEAFPGYEAPISAKEMADYIFNFALTGNKYHNGKIIQVSSTTP